MSQSETPSSEHALAPVTRRAPGAAIVHVVGDLDKADIVAIAAVKFEEQLEAAKGRLNRQMSALNAQIADGEAALQKACKALVEAQDTAAERAAARALKDAGFGTYDVAVSLEQIDENRQQVTLQVTVNPRGTAARGCYGHTLSKQATAPFGPEARQLLKALRAHRQAVGDLSRQLAEVHKKLSSIPALERKARAKLAENALAGSEEGKRILAQLMSLTDGSLPQFLLTDGK